MKLFWRACKRFVVPSLAFLAASPLTAYGQEKRETLAGNPVGQNPPPAVASPGHASRLRLLAIIPTKHIAIVQQTSSEQTVEHLVSPPNLEELIDRDPSPSATQGAFPLVPIPRDSLLLNRPSEEGDLLLVQEPPPATQPPPSTQPPPATQPPPSTATGGEGGPSVRGPSGGFSLAGLSSGGPQAPSAGPSVTGNPGMQSAAQAPSANVAQGGSNTSYLAATDAGSLLTKSNQILGVETQRRSAIAYDTRVRGYRIGETQTWADNQYWFPARQDLDTFLSKIDAGIIQNILVLKGPYTVSRGPGLSFIDIETTPSPRAAEGKAFQWGGQTSSDYKTNGEQYYGRQSFWMAGEDWGVSGSYGQRIGSDYKTGADHKIPGKYDSRDANIEMGADLTTNSHLEFGYLRLDQTGLDFPGQIFDTDYLVTNGFRGRYVVENQELFDRFTLDGWYNETSLKGDAQHADKRAQVPQLNPAPGQAANPIPAPPFMFTAFTFLTSQPFGTPQAEQFGSLGFVGFTEIRESSGGYRVATTWGKEKQPQLTIGTDMNILTQRLNEFDSLFNPPGTLTFIPSSTVNNFAVPPAHQTGFGAFADLVDPIADRLTLRTGVRADYITANVDSLPLLVTPATLQNFLHTTDLERDWGVWMVYGTAEYRPTRHLTLQAGAGHGEVAPTLTELYALDPFLSVLQQGFTNVIGNPDLKPERLWQTDLGFSVQYNRLRFGGTGFYSWINDYITYGVDESKGTGGFKVPYNITHGLTVRFTNTTLATLTGCELYAETDATDWLTPFSTLTYVSGRDWTRDGRGTTVPQTSALNSPVVPGLGALGAPSEPLPGIEPLEARMGFRVHEPVKVPRWSLELSARLDAAQHRVAESLGELPTSGYTVWDLRSFWQPNKFILFTAGIENLFDKNYRDHLDLLTGLSVFQPGITPYMGIQLKY